MKPKLSQGRKREKDRYVIGHLGGRDVYGFSGEVCAHMTFKDALERLKLHKDGIIYKLVRVK